MQKKNTDLAKLYTILFVIFNSVILPGGLFLAYELMTATSTSRSVGGGGGIFLVFLGGVIGVIQPAIGIPLSIFYFRKVRWAKKALLGFLCVILAFWTYLFVYFCIGSYKIEIEYFLVWAVAAALTLPGIILIYRQ